MKHFAFKNPAFLRACGKSSEFPADLGRRGTPEIAVGGRSNVGKSSLLNNLFQSKKLVKTSATPGKTQTINFFSLDNALTFVDLPGYGFAQVPQKIKANWEHLIQQYFEGRSCLCLALCLMDLKRDPSKEDLRFLDWLVSQNKSLIVVFTKSDQIPKTKRETRAKVLLEKLGYEDLQYVLYSVKTGQGKDRLTQMIVEAVNEAWEEVS